MLFDRTEAGERAILVHMVFPHTRHQDDSSEFEELVVTTGAVPCAYLSGKRAAPDVKHFIGKGKLEELIALLEEHTADVVLFNHDLSPSQERNLEKALSCRVLSRTSVILDIFAQRARSFEGKLQVELAQLDYLSTRLIRGWTHLERQKGGIGLRGPGETQLESDRRLLRQRISSIKKKLKKVKGQRSESRKSRQKAETPTISFVGYTNAGKSTLFNFVTESNVYAHDQLFATLDPTLRKVPLDHLGNVIFADTVGFIRHLPHKLIDAFRSTLEETKEADLLLHVVDASADDRDGHIEQVDNVLTEIEASDIPFLMVFNKIDLFDRAPSIDRDKDGCPIRVWLSAKTGEGVALLLQAIDELLSEKYICQDVVIPSHLARIRAKLYNLGAIKSEKIAESGDFLLKIKISERHLMQLAKSEGIKTCSNKSGELQLVLAAI